MIEKLPFHHIDQIGVIVRDMNRAVKFYESLGMGHFMSPGISVGQRKVYGKIANDVVNMQMSTQSGQVEFELVQPVRGNSIQFEFLKRNGEGINHLGFFVDDVAKATTLMESLGFKAISCIQTTDGRGDCAYFDTDEIGGVLLEVMTRRQPPIPF